MFKTLTPKKPMTGALPLRPLLNPYIFITTSILDYLSSFDFESIRNRTMQNNLHIPNFGQSNAITLNAVLFDLGITVIPTMTFESWLT